MARENDSLTGAERARLAELMRRRLSPARYRHVLEVAQVAEELAGRFGVDAGKAWLAGLLHDYARELPEEEILAVAGRHGLLALAAEPTVALLHAPVGAVLLREELGITDPDVLRAVASHTTGALGMSDLDKVVFLADYIAPGRSFPGVEAVRAAVARGLDEAVRLALAQTVESLRQRGRYVDPRTLAALEGLG